MDKSLLEKFELCFKLKYLTYWILKILEAIFENLSREWLLKWNHRSNQRNFDVDVDGVFNCMFNFLPPQTQEPGQENSTFLPR